MSATTTHAEPRVVDVEITRDGPALLAMNNAAVPAVNLLSTAELTALAGMGSVRMVRGTQPEGFIVLIPPGAAYDSDNYAFFSERFDAFLYVDRVVVAEGARGSGVGRALYADAMARARAEGRQRLCSEVNVRPPNPVSMAFHTRLGFDVIAERESAGSGKRVAMMARPV